MEYYNLQGSHLTDLEETVREWIEDGWEPLGGVQIDFQHPDRSGKLYTQTMIKEEDK